MCLEIHTFEPFEINSFLMKKNLLALLAILMLGLYASAQSVNVSGHVTNSGTGAAAVNFPVEVLLYDSLTSTVIVQSQMFTDTSGNYAFAFVTSNGPLVGNGVVKVTDCNGGLHSLYFNWTNGTGTFANLDFAICMGSGGCTAAFVAGNGNGGLTIPFTDYSTSSLGAIVSQYWQFGDSSFGSGSNVTHTYPAAGTYLVCLTIATSQGCTSSFCDTVVVGGSSTTCYATISYGIFQSGAYGFTVAASGSATPVSYSYDFGDGNVATSNLDSILYTYGSSGTYTACVTVLFSDSCTATGCVNVGQGNGNCVANFFAVPDTTGQYALLLVNNSVGTGLNYLWDFGDSATSTSAYPQHTYSGPGTYLICLTIWDSTNTCSSTFCDTVVVINKLGSAFTIQVVPAILLGSATALESNASIMVYPVPATDRLNIQLDLSRQAHLSLSIVDLHGRIVLANAIGMMSSGRHELVLPIGELTDGIYLLKVDAGVNGIYTKRLLVNH